MNFDLKNVEAFLTRIDTRLRLQLPVQDLVKMTRETEIKHERKITLLVDFQGAKVSLEYRVFMDDADSPHLYFFTRSKQLADAIDKELAAFADANGLRSNQPIKPTASFRNGLVCLPRHPALAYLFLVIFIPRDGQLDSNAF